MYIYMYIYIYVHIYIYINNVVVIISHCYIHNVMINAHVHSFSVDPFLSIVFNQI